MKIIWAAFFLLFFVLGIISCKRNEAELILPPTDNDTIAVSRFIWFATGAPPPGLDTSVIADYTYDSQKRIAEVDHIMMTTTGTRSNYQSRYYYNGNDKLPYKLIVTYKPNSLDSLVVDIRYDNNGFIIKDSALMYFGSGGPPYYHISEYSSLGNGRFLRKFFIYPLSSPKTISDSIIYKRTVVEGNITALVDSTWRTNGTTLELYNVSASRHTYDNKINPLYKRTLFSLGYYENIRVQFFYGLGINNIVSSTYETLFPTPATLYTNARSYEYNSQNYPVIGRHIPSNEISSQFFYTRL